MKVLLKLFSLIVLLGVVFAGCQSGDTVTSPVSESVDKGGTLVWEIPDAVNGIAGDYTEVDLVAGQHDVVGYVSIQQDGGNLVFNYYVDGDWTITETHISVGAQPSDIPHNSQGNPQIGLFEYNATHDNVTSVGPISIPIPSGLTDNKVYIGIHAVVEAECGENGTAVVCPALPEMDTMTPKFLPNGVDYTVKTTFDNFGIYYGWCIDATRYINSDDSRSVSFICSYSENLPTCTTFIEHPENLDLVNWIINHRQTDWDRRTVQAAIWELLSPSGALANWNDPSGPDYWVHNEVLREEIVSLAEGHEGYVPDECGDKVLIIVYQGTEACSTPSQVVAFEYPISCICSETAWAFNYPPTDGTSELFPGHIWFRYFGYLVASN